MKKKVMMPQQVFLREAMNDLGMTRQEFANRFHIPKRRLDNWLLPDNSDGMRELDPSVRQFITEILHLHSMQKRVARVIKSMRDRAADNPNGIQADTLAMFANEVETVIAGFDLQQKAGKK